MARLDGKRVAILATHGFEQSELTAPRDALTEAGAQVEVVSPESGEIQGFHHFDKGDKVRVDRALGEALGTDYDALVIPGGLFNPDQLRVNEEALQFTREFFEAGKPVAAICHGPWVLVNARCVKGREMTAVRTIHCDLTNAGAKVVDKEVVVDEGLVTSRTPQDLPAFCAKLVEEVAQGRRRGQQRPSPGRGSGRPDRQVVS
jgi:protease I